AAFGSHSDADHCYNTPRAWYMLRTLSPNNFMGTPEDDDLPWCMVPDKKITVEDVKYVLSAYYQGTPYNPYAKHGDASLRGMYRPIGINRNNFLAVTQLRPYAKKELMAIEWLAVGSNAFNELVPFYSNVTTTPAYLANTTGDATTEDFYWSNRLVAVMADAHYSSCIAHIERYQQKLMSFGHGQIIKTDKAFETEKPENVQAFLEKANCETAAETKKQTTDLLNKVLQSASLEMKNGFSRADA
nr:C69 family dipeptidase [Lachnospiraceae bacterium]